MAPATTPTVKILTDLGYQVWEMESDADMLRALVEAINTLSITNPNDGRISILQRAIKGLRVKRRSAAPSAGQKYSVTRKRLKGSNFIPKAKPAATSRVNPVALLPAASEDQSVFSTLVKAFTNIGSLLKRIGGILRIQFLFKKLLAARQRRKDALDEKRKREGELESDSGGLGKRITNTLTKPIKSFWGTLLNFFKNILIGSALLGFVKWMKDPKNLETIQGIAEWFSKNGENVLKGIVAILGLGIGYRIFRLVTRVGKAIGRLVQISGALIKGGTSLLQKLLKGGYKIIQSGLSIKRSRDIIEGIPLLKGIPKLYPILSKELTKKVGQEALLNVVTKGVPVDDAIREAGIKYTTQQSSNILSETATKSFAESATQSDKALKAFKGKYTKALKPQAGEKILQIIAKGRGVGAAQGPFGKGGKVVARGMEELINKGGIDPKLLKPITEVPKDFIPKAVQSVVTEDAPRTAAQKAGQKLLTGSGKKLATNTALKGTLKNVARGLPFLGTYLDTVSAIDEIKKGNFIAAGLFGAGAVTSIIPGMQGASLGFSLSAIAASVVEDKINTPNLSMNKKKDVKVTVVPLKSEDKISNSGSGDTNTKVYSVSSIDRSNPNSFVNQNLFNMVGV